LKTKILLLFLPALLLAGCARDTLVTRYYLLDYQPDPVNPKLILSQPFPYRVQVLNFKIPRSYDSIRIIARYSSHQINYYRYSLWAVRPQMAIADLLMQHINAYQLFKDCEREFLEERPDYEITGEVQQVERYESQGYTAAHLKMTFDLYDYNSANKVVTHEFDREVPIAQEEMTIFAKVISDIIDQETENFLVDVVDYFNGRSADSSGTVK
jgi:ABC-type uncharacterized transport system auxiliary subunit